MTSFVRRIALFISFSCIFAGDPEALGTAFMASVQRYVFGGKSVPRWTGGSLIALDRSDTEEVEVRAFDRTGSLVSHFPFRIPAAYRLTPKSGQFARGFDGSFVLAGGAYSDDSRAAPFIAWISSDGSQQRVIP